MKKHAKIVFKEFGSSFGRFMAIAGIIALGLAFLIGINQTTPDLKASFTNFFTENSLYDFSVRGAFSAEDVEEMAAVEGVNETEALISYDAYATAEGSSKERTVRFYGMDDLAAADDENALNRLTIVDGEMPDSPDEVVAIKPFGNMESVAVGDKLTVKPKGMTETMIFAETELTVSAIATSPIYFSNNDEICSIGDGNIDFIVFTSSDVFNTRLMEMGGSRYTEVWATAAGADEFTAFTDDYDDLVAGVKEDLEALADAHAPAEGDATGTAWYVLDRSTNLSYYSLSINADKVANLAGVFPAFFIAVAALVAFSTIVRMVNEDRLQIGHAALVGLRRAAHRGQVHILQRGGVRAGTDSGRAARTDHTAPRAVERLRDHVRPAHVPVHRQLADDKRDERALRDRDRVRHRVRLLVVAARDPRRAAPATRAQTGQAHTARTHQAHMEPHAVQV